MIFTKSIAKWSTITLIDCHQKILCRFLSVFYIHYTVEFFRSGTHGTRKVPVYEIILIIKQYLYWPKFLQFLIYLFYCTYIGSAQRTRVLLWISPSAVSSGTSPPPPQSLHCLPDMLKGQGMWSRSAEEVEGAGNKGSGDITRVTVKTDLEHCEQLLGLELFLSTVKVSRFPQC
jgi:hypothetical protein